jgi:hypothetical protein
MREFRGSRRLALWLFSRMLIWTAVLAGTGHLYWSLVRNFPGPEIQSPWALPIGGGIFFAIPILLYGAFAAGTLGLRLRVTSDAVTLTCAWQTVRVERARIAAQLLEDDNLGRKCLTLVHSDGVLSFGDWFDAPLEEIRKAVTTRPKWTPFDTVATLERTRWAKDEIVYRDHGARLEAFGAVMALALAMPAALLAYLEWKIAGAVQPLNGYSGQLAIAGMILCVFAVHTLFRYPARWRQRFFLATPDFVMERGERRQRILCTRSISSALLTRESSFSGVKLTTKDGNSHWLEERDVEDEVRRIVGLPPTAWAGAEVSMAQALRILGSPRIRNWWRLVSGEVTTVHRSGITRYVRAEVEALRDRPAERRG